MKHLYRFAVIMVMLVAASCAPHVHVFVHPEVDMAFYSSVGVVPFRSLSTDRFAGEKFSVEFTTALLAADLFEVVDYGVFVSEVNRTLGSRSPADGLTEAQLKAIASATDVQGIFQGTVKQYDMVTTGSGSYPVISVEARLVDAETGKVVWMATVTERGGPKTPIIGIGETHTLGELAQKLSKKLVDKLE